MEQLKAELKRRNVTYEDLSARLGAVGIHETERNLNNKNSGGGFSTIFFVQSMVAIGCQNVRISED